METQVDFSSNIFKPYLPDESQVNPKVYGAELAYWLSQKLAEKGFFTSYPEYEDWGWYLDYYVADNEYRLCCGNVDNSETDWQITLEAYPKGFFGRNKPSIEYADSLLVALRSVLRESQDIKNINWVTLQNT
ncbi:hypothetical protein J7384_16830 [Endozoicomonas sp. G2_1]|uniref:hypothetical protein n=1 Tax=Endozoicomonas sp. G2_1 TaxID=2821091 RepID=UPI001ADCBC1E|nr:hypothetical protein [Endozoicomonas sp. G2_1]MBO9492028.1 hypothetical protein [Endozoicomonas sp. G2_1]